MLEQHGTRMPVSSGPRPGPPAASGQTVYKPGITSCGHAHADGSPVRNNVCVPTWAVCGGRGADGGWEGGGGRVAGPGKALACVLLSTPGRWLLPTTSYAFTARDTRGTLHCGAGRPLGAPQFKPVGHSWWGHGSFAMALLSYYYYTFHRDPLQFTSLHPLRTSNATRAAQWGDGHARPRDCGCVCIGH